MNGTHPTILHVDDDRNDLLLFQRACQKVAASFQIKTLSEGEHAIAYLSGTGDYSDRGKYPLPALVLLDLKMPRMNGFEVLTWIRSQEKFKGVPVIAFTSSNHPDDIHQAYQLGANSYVAKPVDFDALTDVARMIDFYWLTLNRRAST